MRKIVFTTLFIFITQLSSLQAKSIIRGYIQLKDSTEIKARLVLPKMTDKKLSYYDEKGEKKKISSKDIEQILVWNEKDVNATQYKFVYKPIKFFVYRNDDFKILDEKWLFVSSEKESLNVYFSAYHYEIDRHGKVTFTTRAKYTGFYSAVWIYFWREGEECPASIDGKPGYLGRYFQNFGAKYFSDKPDLVEQIKSKKFNGLLMEEFLDIYYENWTK